MSENKDTNENKDTTSIPIVKTGAVKLKRGRKQKYHTEEEKAEAARRRTAEYYNRNKEYCNQYSKIKYQERKAKQQIITS